MELETIGSERILRDAIIQNHEWLTENLHVDPILHRLRNKNVLMERQFQSLLEPPTGFKKADKLLDWIYRASNDHLTAFAEALNESNQRAVLNILTKRCTIDSLGGYYDLNFIMQNIECIIDNLRFEDSFLARLVADKVILVEDEEELKSSEAQRTATARALMKLVMRGVDEERLNGFIKVLAETEQTHIARVLEEKDTTYLVSKEDRQSVIERRPRYIKAVVKRGFLRQLQTMVTRRIITDSQMQCIEALRENEKKAELLLDIILCRPLGYIENLPGPLFKVFKSIPNLCNNPELAVMNADSDEENEQVHFLNHKTESDSAIGSAPVTPLTPDSFVSNDVSSERSSTDPKRLLKRTDIPFKALRTVDARTEPKRRLSGPLSEYEPVTPETYTSESVFTESTSFMMSNSASHSASFIEKLRHRTSLITESLTPTEQYLKEAQNEMKRKAQQLNSKLLESFGIEKRDTVMYVTLHLLSGERQNFNKKEFQRAVQCDSFNDETQEVDLKYIFDDLNDDRLSDDSGNAENSSQSSSGGASYQSAHVQTSNRRYLLLGVAGIGKSTFCQHLTEKWSKDELWQGMFKLTILIQCRRLNFWIDQKEKMSLLDLIYRHCPVFSKGNKIHLLKDLLTNKGRVLIIFDGLDELNGLDANNFGDMPELNDPNSPEEIPVLINGITNGSTNLLPGAVYLFTSRPMNSLLSENFIKTIRIFGFGRQSIDECINELCHKNHEIKKKVVDYLERRPHLYHFCSVPITCVMTGKVVHDELNSNSLVEDLSDSKKLRCATDLYVRVLISILKSRPKSKSAELSGPQGFEIVKQLKENLLKLIEFAAYGVVRPSQKQVFNSKELKMFGINHKDLICGLLDLTQGDFNDLDRDDIACSFIHFSVQEFLAAVHIGITWNKSYLKLITSNETTSSQFDLVLLYLSGLLGNPLGNELLRTLNPSLNEKRFMRRLDNLFKLIVDQYKTWKERFLGKFKRRKATNASNKLMKLWVVRCVAEANASRLVEKVNDLVLQGGELDLREMPGGLHPLHMPAIAFYLQESKQVKSLSMERKPGLQLMRMITTKNQNCIVPKLNSIILDQEKRLNIRAFELEDDDMKGLVIYVLNSNAYEKIDIDVCIRLMQRIDDDNRKELISKLDRCVLTREMNSSWEEQDGCLIISDQISLTKQDMWGLADYISNSEKVTLFRPSKAALQLMQFLVDTGNKRFQFKDALAAAFDRCLLSNWQFKGKTTNGRLDLSGTKITEKEALGLSAYLRKSTKVTKLEFEETGLNDLLMKYVCDELLPQSKVQELSLSSNHLSDNGIRDHLVNCVVMCPSINRIRMKHTKVTEEGKRCLLAARMEGPQLEVEI